MGEKSGSSFEGSIWGNKPKLTVPKKIHKEADDEKQQKDSEGDKKTSEESVR
jgi:hypothetical protein